MLVMVLGYRLISTTVVFCKAHHLLAHSCTQKTQIPTCTLAVQTHICSTENHYLWVTGCPHSRSNCTFFSTYTNLPIPNPDTPLHSYIIYRDTQWGKITSCISNTDNTNFCEKLNINMNYDNLRFQINVCMFIICVFYESQSPTDFYSSYVMRD